MADNVEADPGSGGATLAADDIGGVHYPRVKIVLGADGVADGDVSSALPMPVDDATAQASLASIDGKITAVNTGDVTVSSSVLPSGAATAANQATIAGHLDGVETLLGTIDADTGNIATSIAVLDDWDENDRAKVNPIVGQDGVAAGNGAVGANTQRMTLAASASLANVGTVASVTTVSTVTGGAVAHDSPDSGNPLKVGAKAQTSLKAATMVANADRVDQVADLDGAQIVRPMVPLGDILVERRVDSGGASSAFSTFNGSAGVRNYITAITVSNSNASLDGTMDLRDGTAGSAFWTIPLPHAGGAHLTFNPPLRQPTAATQLAMDVSAAIPDITVSVCGFQSKA